MKRSGFRQQSIEEVKAKQAIKREKDKSKPRKGLQRSKLTSKGIKPKKAVKTARSKKQALKRKICEQYGFPIIPCSRWGTSKNPTRTDLLRGMAWHVFSKHIRERDVEKPCITCGLPLAFGDIQAGHYVPVGNSSIALHFLEDNVNGEHPTCNADFQGWHLVPMRKNMVKRYGEDRINDLDKMAGMKDSIKYSEEYFVNLIKRYL